MKCCHTSVTPSERSERCPLVAPTLDPTTTGRPRRLCSSACKHGGYRRRAAHCKSTNLKPLRNGRKSFLCRLGGLCWASRLSNG
jgi:hypothetical protein